MELSILRSIQTLHSDFLSNIMIFVSFITNHGEAWIVIALIMLCFKKMRKCGITISISLIMALVIGNVFLKNLIARDRPFWVDESIALLATPPTSYSFPSGHTFSAFAASISILLYSKKLGIPAVVLASSIAFSRMYLFFHYPTDVLAGIILGIIVALISYRLVNNVDSKHLKPSAR